MPPSVFSAVSQNAKATFKTNVNLFGPINFITFIWGLSYIFMQRIIIALFKPPLPKSEKIPTKPFGRIAVVGAGLTGVSSAAHAVSHNFDVQIYEAAPRSGLGGIWTRVNSTSGLQLNSLLYRFHPAVLWSRAFPVRDEIVSEITRIWKDYQLESRTRFDTRVTSIRRADPSELPQDIQGDLDPTQSGHARWVINDGADGVFDAVIVTIGTCGKPKWVWLDGMPEDLRHHDSDSGEHSKHKSDDKVPVDDSEGRAEDGTMNAQLQPGISYADVAASGSTPHSEHTEETELHEVRHRNGNGRPSDTNSDKENRFTKPIVHSSQLDSPELTAEQIEGKHVVVIGSGASGVEAVETALQRGARKVWMVARTDKWIIPRNIIVDTFLAFQPFGREMPLSFLWEYFIRRWHYTGVEDLVPADQGIFEGTPVVNDDFLGHVRDGRCIYARGDPVRLNSKGVIINSRKRGTKSGEKGDEKLIEADVVVLATGFEHPDMGFLDGGLFLEDYQRPDLYLQNFSTEDWSILTTNSAYKNAIGTVGHFHIGIYTRILLTLLMDKNARPSPKDMKLWVDVVRFVKRGATGGALGFFTYAELTLWLVGFHLFRPDRLRWMFFIMQGWGVHAPEG